MLPDEGSFELQWQGDERWSGYAQRVNLAPFVGIKQQKLRRRSASDIIFRFDRDKYPGTSRNTQEELATQLKEVFKEQGLEVKVHEWAKEHSKDRDIRRIRLYYIHADSGGRANERINFQVCFADTDGFIDKSVIFDYMCENKF